ncbi:endoplasmic reticulum multispan transmembrane protein-related [Anaeramoeba ignava]|uniref:Protein RFT1 homolog n=1 Tax=Anaeramoeba ignava TaxID=1746090 RepID=A0A9Q0LTV2_ANAIG|nr:endoplasmic reticulum multispan transmembrane protein-related [Anaeramoeba ignava]
MISKIKQQSLYLILLQGASRAISFLFNLWIYDILYAQKQDVASFALINFRFPLIRDALLDFSRSGYRRAFARTDTQNKATLPTIFTIVPLSAIPFGIIFSILTYLLELSGSGTDLENYSLLLGLLCFTTWLELVSEPFYIVMQSLVHFDVRMKVEGLAAITRSISLYLIIRFFNMPLFAFSISQFLCSFITFLGYGFYYISDKRVTSKEKPNDLKGFRIFFKIIPNFRKLFHLDQNAKEMLKLVGSFTLQNVFVFVLTTIGDIILLTFRNFEIEAIYGLANNIGSLGLRIVYFPIEETIYTLISLKVASLEKEKEKQNLKENQKEKEKENQKRKSKRKSKIKKKIKKKIKIKIKTKLLMLKFKKFIKIFLVFRLVFLIAFFYSVFGSNYTFLFTKFMIDNKPKSEISLIIGFYFIYTFFVIMNGINEIFVRSVSSKSQLFKNNILLVVFSGLYIAFIYTFAPRYGSMGFILANILNKSVSGIYFAYFTYKYFTSFKVSFNQFFLDSRVTLACFFIAIILFSSSYFFWIGVYGLFIHFIIGIFCFLLLCGFVYKFEKRTWKELLSKKKTD